MQEENMIQNAADKRKWLNILGAALLFAAVVEQMFTSTTTDRSFFINFIYTFGILAQFAFIFFCGFTKNKLSFALKTIVLFFVWLVLTRPLLGDVQLIASIPTLIPTALNVGIICYAASLEDGEGKKLFKLIAPLICVFYCYVCIGLLYAAVTRNDISLLPFIGIKMKEEGGLHYVDLISSHRNTSAQWYCVCFCIAVCLAALSKSKAFKALCGAMMAVFFLTVAISLSRISMIALAFAIGMMTALVIVKHFPNKKTSVHVAVALAAVLVVTPVIYKSYSLVGSAVEKLSLAVTPIEQTTEPAAPSSDLEINESVSAPPSDSKVTIENGDAMFTETRDKENTMMLGGRVLVWNSIYTLLKNEPSRMRFGGLTSDYIAEINKIISQTDPTAVVQHSHNYLIESLFLTGIPGLFIMLVFSAILLVRMLKVFFSPRAEMYYKLLVIPLSVILVKNMGEATLVWHYSIANDITNYIFFLVAGLFLAYSYELFPEKRRGAKRDEHMQ